MPAGILGNFRAQCTPSASQLLSSLPHAASQACTAHTYTSATADGVFCAGMGLLVLKLTASARAFRLCPRYASKCVNTHVHTHVCRHPRKTTRGRCACSLAARPSPMHAASQACREPSSVSASPTVCLCAPGTIRRELYSYGAGTIRRELYSYGGGYDTARVTQRGLCLGRGLWQAMYGL